MREPARPAAVTREGPSSGTVRGADGRPLAAGGPARPAAVNVRPAAPEGGWRNATRAETRKALPMLAAGATFLSFPSRPPSAVWYTTAGFAVRPAPASLPAVESFIPNARGSPLDPAEAR